MVLPKGRYEQVLRNGTEVLQDIRRGVVCFAGYRERFLSTGMQSVSISRVTRVVIHGPEEERIRVGGTTGSVVCGAVSAESLDLPSSGRVERAFA